MVRETTHLKQTYPDERNKQISWTLYSMSVKCPTSVLHVTVVTLRTAFIYFRFDHQYGINDSKFNESDCNRR